MKTQQNMTPAEEAHADRVDDIGLAIQSLRRSIAQDQRPAIEVACNRVSKCAYAALQSASDADEMAAIADFIAERVRYGVYERLRMLLVPLADALASQLEALEGQS